MYSNAEEIFWTDFTCYMKERAWPLKEKVYFTKMLDSLLDDNERHGTPFSRGNIQEAVSRVMEDNVNNVTMDTFFVPPSLSMHKINMQT